MKKMINRLLPLFILVLMVSCADPYRDGLEAGQKMGKTEGYRVGYDEGRAKGDVDGHAKAKAYFESAGYNEGFADGSKLGKAQGYSNGYTVGKNETYKPNYDRGYAVGKVDGKKEGYDSGYDDGYDDGHDDGFKLGAKPQYDSGYKVGYTDGKRDGHNRGYDKGELDGYDLGYDDGYDFGYDLGYDDGFDDGSLSVGRSKTLKGHANLISLAHNDVFDYSKIPAPKQTRQGFVVKGQVLFSETSLTNKDTLKRAAVVEQYLVLEMAKQVKGKFGLSADRSFKVAKAANHFRKQVSKRALTNEDTNAYAFEIIGSDFKAIAKAYESTLQGNVTAFESVLEKAAEKNDTTPENIAVILTKYFM